MNRREFVTLIGAAARPLAANAQQPGRMRRIGALFASLDEGYLAAFAQGLAPLGWSEDRNVRIDTRQGGGEGGRIRAHARGGPCYNSRYNSLSMDLRAVWRDVNDRTLS